MKYDFLKTDFDGVVECVIYTGKELKVYLPEYYFTGSTKLAEQIGTTMKTIGIFYMEESGKIYKVTAPIQFNMEYSDDYKVKKYKIKSSFPALDYRVLVLERNDKLVTNTKHIKSVDDTLFFLQKILFTAKIPPNISYDDVYEILINNLLISGLDTGGGILSKGYELLLSQLFREKNNLYKPFRMSYKKGKSNPYNYRAVSLKKLPALTSTFGSLSAEDSNQNILNSIVRTRKKIKDSPSPYEEFIKEN